MTKKRSTYGLPDDIRQMIITEREATKRALCAAAINSKTAIRAAKIKTREELNRIQLDNLKAYQARRIELQERLNAMMAEAEDRGAEAVRAVREQTAQEKIKLELEFRAIRREAGENLNKARNRAKKRVKYAVKMLSFARSIEFTLGYAKARMLADGRSREDIDALDQVKRLFLSIVFTPEDVGACDLIKDSEAIVAGTAELQTGKICRVSDRELGWGDSEAEKQ